MANYLVFHLEVSYWLAQFANKSLKSSSTSSSFQIDASESLINFQYMRHPIKMYQKGLAPDCIKSCPTWFISLVDRDILNQSTSFAIHLPLICNKPINLIYKTSLPNSSWKHFTK
eukprot:NODE_532_length_6386_cov_0.597264.p7 type:complete len:115 gc:universal NODE_532_length_6386_cov_0.597264:723-1067(+)